MSYKIPQYVLDIAQALEDAGFEAYLVGGCVRDLLTDTTPKDWDFTTNARPEHIQELFPNSFYENNFGTVGIKISERGTRNAEHSFENTGYETRTVKSDSSGDPRSAIRDPYIDVVEVTTYRTESGYSDKRRPDEVRFADTLEEDLQRRDFTMNAIAMQLHHEQNAERGTSNAGSDSPGDPRSAIRDPYKGLEDIKQKIIRAVGNPEDRFAEDALRMMRAVRFHATLGFAIEEKTLEAIQKNADNLAHIAKERIRVELEKIILSPHPSEGVEMLRQTGLLKHIIPELLEGVGVTQNLHHTYTVWEHNLKALQTCPSKKLSVRLAALLHDVGKPRTKRGDGKFATFYNHDHVGARMTRAILTRLTFPKETVDHATLLVDQHLFYYNVDEVTEAAVRRVIARVGLENMRDLIDVRIGDRLGSGVRKAKPYRLRHFEFMVEKVSRDPVSVKQLKLNGTDLIKDLGMKPGPKIGAILDVLLSEVIEDASKNTREILMSRAKELDSQDLDTLRQTAKTRIDTQRKLEEDTIKKKYWVQ